MNDAKEISESKNKEHHEHDHSHAHEKRTRWVIYLTAVTMVVEIVFGYSTKSMALLADGWHMASHVFALGLTWIAYVMARKFCQTDKFSFDTKKLLALSGFTSAIVLQIVAILMAIESLDRLLHPLEIRFTEAIFVAVIGLAVNGISAFFLHHDHEHHDHNIRSAYLHVLADGLTSITAIIALLAGMYYNWYSLDSISGIISSVVITKWAIDLIRGSAKDLIGFQYKK
jgi:cation diffusion facilitator family transporter